MAASYFPSTDAGLNAWSRNLSDRINADPLPLGIQPERAAQFATIQEQYATAYAAAADPTSWSKALVTAKNDARRALRHAAKLIVATIRGQENVSDAEKVALGLTLPSAGRTAIQAPTHAPNAHVVSTRGLTVELTISDSQVTRRGRAPATAGAAVFSFIGSSAPADPKLWTFETLTVDTSVEVTFPPDTAPGAKVWFLVQWLSPRLERGPFSNAICVNIPGGFSGARFGDLKPSRAAA